MNARVRDWKSRSMCAREGACCQGGGSGEDTRVADGVAVLH